MQNPKALSDGFSFGVFGAGQNLSVQLGNVTGRNVRSLLRIEGESIFGINPPEAPGGPVRLHADFRDENGSPTISIIDNHWRVNTGSWDAVVRGARIKIWKKSREQVLEIRRSPGNEFVVERIEMFHRGILISAKEGRATKFVFPSGTVLETQTVDFDGFDTAIGVSDGRLSLGIGGPGSMSIQSIRIVDGRVVSG